MVSELKLISTSGKGNWAIQKGKEKLAQLHYSSWFSRSAEFVLNEESIEIKSKGIFSNTYLIYREGEEIGTISPNWKNNLLISFKDHSQLEHQLKLKLKGFWSQRFELSNEKKEHLLTLTPKLVWKKLRHDYIIDLEKEGLDPYFLLEALLYAGYAINHHNLLSGAGTTGAIG